MKSKIALFALGCLAFTSCSKKQGMPTGDNKHVVETIAPQVADITTSYPATIRSCQDVNIVAKVSGHILKVYVKEGQEVKAVYDGKIKKIESSMMNGTVVYLEVSNARS